MGRSEVPKPRSRRPGSRNQEGDRQDFKVKKVLRGGFSRSEIPGSPVVPPGPKLMDVTEIFKFLYQKGGRGIS